VPLRVAAATLLLLGAVAVAFGSALQASRGRSLLARPGALVRDVRDVRRRSWAALVESCGVAVLALGLLGHVRPLVWLGALVTGAGALLMSIARRGLARRGRG
jgi:hypothetical protein